ncbi:aminomethyltransferase [Chromatiales bacterium (ex Bugula neritina AB1)]|nr:aminomethyltransferase [Chromatiales bacterium (ex Bugula neritina AB1)]
MTPDQLQIAVNVRQIVTERPNELARTMAPHPLIHQELPYDPTYFVYNRRLATASLNNLTADEVYWRVRTNVILRHTGELPLEIRGPDAGTLLNRVLTRDIAKNRVGRCSYQFACYDDGGMITDGVLVRLASNRFWYGQADGDLFSWLRANARGLDVEVLDPGVWVSQVQGPRSLDVLAAAIDGDLPEPFNYFDMAEVKIAGQPVVLTRSGFTNELGWEFYLLPDTDIDAVGARILEAGKAYDMTPTSADAFRARRIEAGLLNAGSDFNETTTPFAAGLGHLVNLNKGEFCGREALLEADQRCRTWGLRTDGGVAQIGRTLKLNGIDAGIVCSSAWSPFQQCGVALVRLDDPDSRPGTTLDVSCTDGEIRSARTCTTPMYDEKREIPRGLKVDIPQVT